MNHHKTLTYVGFVAILLLVVGLAGWYFFISRQTSELTADDSARGFNIGVPSFTGSRGSTAENIASGFGVAPDAKPADAESKRPPRLWRLNATPVAGAGFVVNGSTTLIRFVERSTGHVFDADPMTGTVTRRTNRLIPKVYDAAVSGERLIMRTLSKDGARETFAGELGTTTIDGFTPLTGTDLGSDIQEIAFDRTGIVFFTDFSGGTRLVRAGFDGSKPTTVREFTAGDFTISVLADNKLVIQEKPGSNILGHAYEIGKAFISLARAPGLTIRARASSTALLIGSDTGTNLTLNARANTNATSTPLNINTTADKCVWAPTMSLTAYCAVPQQAPAPGFLTNWYRGTVHTSDSWQSVEVGAGTNTSLFEMRAEDAIDVEKPMVDTGGNYILFMNARDKSLWVLRILE